MCNFSVAFQGTADDFFARLQKEVTDNGGTVAGDVSGGNFDLPTPLGDVSGTYVINAATCSFSINRKPVLVGCQKIQDVVNQHLGT